MAVVRNLTVKVGADTTDFNTKMKYLSKDLAGLSKKMERVGTNLTKAVTLPIMAVSAASFQLAADLEDAMGAADQIFKDSSGSMKKWAKDLQSYYGISVGEALTYANTMGAMLQNIGGLSEEEAAKQAQKLVELAGDLTAMFGGTTETAVQALTGALKGNNAMLDNYGMGVNDATIKLKAFEMGLIKEGETMTLAEKQAATLALITEQTGDALGQSNRESKGASGSLRSFKTDVKNLGIMIGQELLPIITPMIKKLKEWVEKFAKLKPETKEMIVKAALFAAALGPVILALGKVTGAMSVVIRDGAKLIKFFNGAKTAAALAGGTSGIGKFSAGLGALLGPQGLIALAIIALGGLAVAMHNAVKEYPELVITADDKAEKMGPQTQPAGGWGDFRALQIPAAAKGGIVTKPTLLLAGEAGPEKITPLGKDNAQTINHTGTITVKGVNDKGELVAIVEQSITNNIMSGNRRLPNRTSLIPI